MTKFFKKNNLKRILSGVLAIGALLGIISFLSVLISKDTSSIGISSFKLGGLDENGKYVASETSIYTEDAFGCLGLRIEPEFEFAGDYAVYYYDENENMIFSRTGLDNVYDEDFPLAKYARIVITPEPVDDKGVFIKNFSISKLEVYKYAKQLDITVDKTQEYHYENAVNLFVLNETTADKTFKNTNHSSDWNSVELTEISIPGRVTLSNKVKVDGEYETYDVFVYLEAGETEWPVVAIFDDAGKVINYKTIDPGTTNKPAWIKLNIEAPDLESYEGVHLFVHYPTASSEAPEGGHCYIFGYND